MSHDLIRLDALTPTDVEQVRIWRAQTPSLFRTRVPLTPQMQHDFYLDTVSDRRSEHRYWAVRGPELVGQVGLVGIEWENGLAEISLVVAPDHRHLGIGARAVELVLEEAFDAMRLVTVWGECYGYNRTGVEFWTDMLKRYEGISWVWPRRKWHQGRLHDSFMFQFYADGWMSARG